MHPGSQVSGFQTQSLTRAYEKVPPTEAQISEHKHLVHTAARRLSRSLPSHIDMLDLVSAGYVGLIEALQRFDETREISFNTYAFTRIRGAMLDSLRKLDWGSRDLRRRGRAVDAAIAKCTAVLGRVPEEEETAKELGITLCELQRLLGELDNIPLSSFETLADNKLGTEVEFMIDHEEPGALVHCLRAEMQALVAEGIKALPKRERLVVTLYYYEELTNHEIAALMEVSPTRVAQLRAAAILRLRNSVGKYDVEFSVLQFSKERGAE